MYQAVKAVSFGLLLSLSMLNGIKSDCHYYQEMEVGPTYYVNNSEYGYNYKGENHCIWEAKSPYTIKINCTDISIPQSKDCAKECISIQFDGSNVNKYCGYGSFTIEGKNAIIKLDTEWDAQGGRFLCELKTENPSDCQCGWKKTTKIVGGEETGVNEYPMMAGLVDSENRVIYCGATIISKSHVVTAAHCVENRDMNKVGILVGEHDVTIGEETNATRLHRIKKCTIHPQYDSNTSHDIAVCETNDTIEFNAAVGPVCLPFQHKQDSFDNENVTALGWGLTEFAGAKATKLQKVNLTVMNLNTCNDKYESHNKDSSEMCTYTNERKDTCQMDSGGPILWQDPVTYRLVLVGITSSGVGCASGVPAVCTRAGYYIEWIQSVTPGMQYCKAE
nr:PREDICTED: venom serine protease-like isoform X1 [Linepithema humile]